MSYCRFGGDSDVYVFGTSVREFDADERVVGSKDVIECCGCILQERVWVDDPSWPFKGYLKAVGEIVEHAFDTPAEMIEHLERHRRAGHMVPEYAMERLREETGGG
jgi:hypothetical protein